MGKAGQALREVLEQYKISQYRLAQVMQIERNNVSRWVREERDPLGDTVREIALALKTIDPEAAEAFVTRYLGDVLGED